MKKILCFFLMTFMLIGCHQKTQRIQIEGIQEIQYEELTQNLNSNVKFILYIGRDDCGDCQEFYPILDHYIQTHAHTGIYYLNIKELRDRARSENASKEEKEFYENLTHELHFEWTPTIHVISNGRFIDTYQYLDEDYYKIKDKDKQKQRKQDFIDEFEVFMNKYFKEEVS